MKNNFKESIGKLLLTIEALAEEEKESEKEKYGSLYEALQHVNTGGMRRWACISNAADSLRRAVHEFE